MVHEFYIRVLCILGLGFGPGGVIKDWVYMAWKIAFFNVDIYFLKDISNFSSFFTRL